jgi:NADH:ubiquinone oxidoreductase subunit E
MKMQRSELRPLLQKKFPTERTYLLPVLHFLQHEFGYLPDWALQIVSWHLRIPASEVYGAATSYSELRIGEPGKHVVRVCNGLSCWHNGGQELLECLSARFSISPGETTPGGGITLEETPCGFLCPMAPAVEIDGCWRGRITPQAIYELVKGLAELVEE